MFCTKCGYNAGDAKFCPKCGNPLTVNVPVQEPVAQAPVQPIMETPVQPVMETPVQPVMETPVQPVVEAPVEPVVAQPQAVVEQPVEPQVTYTATPVQEPAAQAPVQPTMETPVQPQFNGQAQPYGGQPQFNGQAQPYGGQPQFNNQAQPYGGQPQFNSQPMMEQVAPKKKKKWPKVAGIAVAVVVILGVAGFFAVPYIQEMFSPKTQAVSALKSASADLESMLTNAVSEMSTTTIQDKNQMQGSIKLDRATVDGTDFMSYFKVDTIQYNIQFDAGTGTMSGTFGLATGTSASVLSLQFYIDANYIYFKVPELSKESIRVSVSDLNDPYNYNKYGYLISDISAISTVLGSANPTVLSQYTDVIEAAIKDVMVGVNAVIDSCTYTKQGSSTYQSENGDLAVTIYDVILTKAALINGANATIDALYNDQAVSSYMMMLSSLTVGGNKESLKSNVQSALEEIPDVPFTMYLSDKKVVKLSLDVSKLDSNATGELSVEFIGKENASDYVVMKMVIDELSMKYTIKSEGTTAAMELEVYPDQKTYAGQYIKMGIQASVDGSTSKIDSLYLQGNIDEYVYDLAISGNTTVGTFSTMTISTSAFSNYIDLYKMTDAQEDAIILEIADNISIFKKIIADSLFESAGFDDFGLGNTAESVTPSADASTNNSSTGL